MFRKIEKMRLLFSLILVIVVNLSSLGQNTFKISIQDSVSHEKLFGVSILIKNSTKGVSTDFNGEAEIKNIPNGKTTFVISYIGYKEVERIINFPLSEENTPILIYLSPVSTDLDEIVVSSTRTNSRIEDLPMKVEVLGKDEMDEESSIVPGGIGSILGDLSIITIQKTNPVNGNDAVRMQGLDYKYTQLLRDGLPLYEGFSGSLGVLSIPPLDLKQVEIIKGSASTLYGGGAVGGLINFISKTPSDSANLTLLLNQTSLNESDVNAFLSLKGKSVGFTLFVGSNIKKAFDINKDGFAEIPKQNNVIVHPRWFFYVSKKVNADLGLTVTSDYRKGGDMFAIQHKEDSVHTFLFWEKVLRGTADGHVSYDINKENSLNIKSTGSYFDRSLYYNSFNFSGKQISSYSEISHLFKSDKHTLVSGINIITESFVKEQGDSVFFNNYNYRTIGIFSQEDWQLFKKISLEAGVRADFHTRYKWFVLPRIGIFYKPGEKLSVRLHYGTGYKTPNLFTTSQPEDFAMLEPVSNTVKPELSQGVNMDINYHFILFEKLSVQVNQAFYYTNITNPTILGVDTSGNKVISNAVYMVNSTGSDTYIRFGWKTWEFYVGYNHTEAKQEATGINFNMPFNPKDKLAFTLAFEIEDSWRMGVEAAYNANQYIYNNIKVPDYWFFAGMIERKFNFGSIVLNCENIGDYRQSKHESLYTGTTKSPIFKDIWGPVEGRVLNLSVKINL